MPGTLQIKSAQYGYVSITGDALSDVTDAVRTLLSQSTAVDYFSFQVSATKVGLNNPNNILGTLVVTFYWSDRGDTWTFTSTWVDGQTLKIPVNIPPMVKEAFYNSPNITIDVTARLQQFVALHTDANWSFTIGSAQFLNALFGSAQKASGAVPIDPDLLVTKSLYVKYSQMYKTSPTAPLPTEKTNTYVGCDGMKMSLI